MCTVALLLISQFHYLLQSPVPLLLSTADVVMHFLVRCYCVDDILEGLRAAG